MCYLFLQIEQISELYGNGTVGGTGEKIPLGVAVEVGEGVVVPAFQLEIARFGAQLYAGTGSDAVIKLVVDGFAMLFGGDVCVFRSAFPVPAYQIGRAHV